MGNSSNMFEWNKKKENVHALSDLRLLSIEEAFDASGQSGQFSSTSQFPFSPVITSYISIILPAAVVGKGKAASHPSHGISSF